MIGPDWRAFCIWCVQRSGEPVAHQAARCAGRDVLATVGRVAESPSDQFSLSGWTCRPHWLGRNARSSVARRPTLTRVCHARSPFSPHPSPFPALHRCFLPSSPHVSRSRSHVCDASRRFGDTRRCFSVLFHHSSSVLPRLSAFSPHPSVFCHARRRVGIPRRVPAAPVELSRTRRCLGHSSQRVAAHAAVAPKSPYDRTSWCVRR